MRDVNNTKSVKTRIHYEFKWYLIELNRKPIDYITNRIYINILVCENVTVLSTNTTQILKTSLWSILSLFTKVSD